MVVKKRSEIGEMGGWFKPHPWLKKGELNFLFQ